MTGIGRHNWEDRPHPPGGPPAGYQYTIDCCGFPVDIVLGRTAMCPGCRSTFEIAPAVAMTLAQARLMSVGLELHRTLQLRAARAALMKLDGWHNFGPASMAAFLLGLAAIDQRIRHLRGLTADCLEATAEVQS